MKTLRTIKLWLLIVWRPVHADASGVYRLSASVAWELAQSLAVPLVDEAGRSFFDHVTTPEGTKR